MYCKNIFLFIVLTFVGSVCLANNQTYNLDINNQTGYPLQAESSEASFPGPNPLPLGNTHLSITSEENMYFFSVWISNATRMLSKCDFRSNPTEDYFDLAGCESTHPVGYLVAKMSADHKSVTITLLPESKKINS